MTDNVWLEPVPTRRGGNELVRTGAEITALRESIGGRISDAGDHRPWGLDGPGETFQRVYAQHAPTILAIWSQLGTYVQGLGANVVHAVDAMVETEAANDEQLRMTRKALP